MLHTRCLRIRLKPGSEARVRAWAAELNARMDEVKATLVAEGVMLEAVFYDPSPAGDSLIYVLRAADFDHAVQVARQSLAPIDAYHQQFKRDCWEERIRLECLLDAVIP